MLTSPRASVRLLLLALVVPGCGGDDLPPPAAQGNVERKCRGASETVDADEETPPDAQCPGGERSLLCFGNWAAHCSPEGDIVELTNCRLHDEVCVSHKCDDAGSCDGCRVCAPGEVQCGADGELSRCREDGSGFDFAQTCDEAAGQRCSVTAGVCVDLCAAAAEEHSYIGCEYWAVATSNAQLEFWEQDEQGICQPFSFAVVIANPQGVDAHVTIDTASHGTLELTVRPGQARSVELPCIPELKNTVVDYASLKRPASAHRIRSDAPVTVYQFNPLEYELDQGRDPSVYSHTNDASLLLPTHALTGNYRVMAQPTLLHQLDRGTEGTTLHSGPGFVTLVGVEDEPVDVEITASAYTRGSEDGTLPALAPGESLQVSLEQGEVLQLVSDAPSDCDFDDDESEGLGDGLLSYCRVGDDYDLTGTRIRATGKVSVVAGHDCAFLPYNRWACDHLEETMFPLESWGKEILVSGSEAVECQDTVPNLVRVLSDTDDNRINFVPEAHPPVTLSRGEFVEFEIVGDVRVSASDAILVGQFLVGQDYEGRGSSGTMGKGDPAFSLGIPLEQWRSRYSFLAPSTFTDNFVNVIAREDQVVLLDDRLVEGFRPLEGTGLATARVRVGGGEHRLESLANVGIVVYGYAVYTSYMVPGGLDLNPIHRPD